MTYSGSRFLDQKNRVIICARYIENATCPEASVVIMKPNTRRLTVTPYTAMTQNVNIPSNSIHPLVHTNPINTAKTGHEMRKRVMAD